MDTDTFYALKAIDTFFDLKAVLYRLGIKSVANLSYPEHWIYKKLQV